MSLRTASTASNCLFSICDCSMLLDLQVSKKELGEVMSHTISIGKSFLFYM